MTLLHTQLVNITLVCVWKVEHMLLVWLESIRAWFIEVFGLSALILSQMSNNLCLLQKRKVEAVPLATQVSPATPVPSLPSSAEASQASVFPAVRETNTFKSREDHDQLSSLTTVKNIFLGSSVFELEVF